MAKGLIQTRETVGGTWIEGGVNPLCLGAWDRDLADPPPGWRELMDK